MQYVPSLPPPVVGGVDRYEGRQLPRVQATHPAQQRSLPPLIFQHRRREPVREAGSAGVERRHDVHVNGERRTYCRRSVQRPMLLELRSGVERRRHAQRGTDETDHVDEKV